MRYSVWHIEELPGSKFSIRHEDIAGDRVPSRKYMPRGSLGRAYIQYPTDKCGSTKNRDKYLMLLIEYVRNALDTEQKHSHRCILSLFALEMRILKERISAEKTALKVIRG